jgi:hypothetical protein
LTHAPDGILLMTVDTVEGGVCDDGFTAEDARVSCNELYGSPDVLSFSQGHACGAVTEFWLDDVSCTGTEGRLYDCNHPALGAHNCNVATECVQLYCVGGGV